MSIPSSILIGVVLFLAVSGAGVFAWTVCVVAAVVSVAYAACAWKRAPFPMIRRVYAAILIFLLLSLVPLPLSLTGITGARRHKQNATAAETLKNARALRIIEKRPALWFAATRNSAGTLRITALSIAVFGALMLAAMLNQPAKEAYLCFLVCAAVIIAAIGYVGQWLIPQGDTLWWLFPIPHGLPGPVACFGNRNHFAGFLAMLCPPALSLAVRDFAGRRPARGLVFAGAFCALTLVLLLTLSRGAFVAYLAGLFAVLILLAKRRRLVACLLPVLLISGMAALYLFLPESALKQRMRTLRRPLETDSAQVRINAWRDTLAVWRAYPLTGAGANGFRTTYPQHRATSAGAYMTHPDNEYVQLLAETGLIGVALFAAAGAAFLYYARLSKSQTASERAIRAAAFGSITVAAAHACLDFPLHAPLYAIALATLAGLVLDDASVNPRENPPLTPPGRGTLWVEPPPGKETCGARDTNTLGNWKLEIRNWIFCPIRSTEVAPLAHDSIPLRAAFSIVRPFSDRLEQSGLRFAGWPALLNLLTALTLCFFSRSMQRLDSHARLKEAGTDELARALVWAPTSWHVWYYLGRQACLKDSTAGLELGERCIAQAAAYDPNNYRLWLELGKLRLRLNDLTGARIAFARVRALRSWAPIPDVPTEVEK